MKENFKHPAKYLENISLFIDICEKHYFTIYEHRISNRDMDNSLFIKDIWEDIFKTWGSSISIEERSREIGYISIFTPFGDQIEFLPMDLTRNKANMICINSKMVER